MKKYLIIVLLNACFIGRLVAQEIPKGYFNRTKFGLQPGVDYGERPPSFEQGGSLISTINGFLLTPKLGLGLGVGYSAYNHPGVKAIPVFANVDYYFLNKRSTPYAVGSLGYGFVTNNVLVGGLVGELGVGWRFKSGKKIHLGPELAYRYQSYGYKGYDGYRERLKSIFFGFNIMF